MDARWRARVHVNKVIIQLNMKKYDICTIQIHFLCENMQPLHTSLSHKIIEMRTRCTVGMKGNEF